MDELQILKRAIFLQTGMNEDTFNLSEQHWQLKTYRKGEFYNEYKNICKHLGFVINGVFRIYRVNELNGEEKNMLFFSANQFIASYKSFITQSSCDYFTESMVQSTVLYIHIDQLNKLYRESHEWERFGRLIAEKAYEVVMTNTEGFLFMTAEDRYKEMIDRHPDIFNAVPLYHIASYLGIQGPSLSRIRKRIARTK